MIVVISKKKNHQIGHILWRGKKRRYNRHCRTGKIVKQKLFIFEYQLSRSFGIFIDSVSVLSLSIDSVRVIWFNRARRVKLDVRVSIGVDGNVGTYCCNLFIVLTKSPNTLTPFTCKRAVCCPYLMRREAVFFSKRGISLSFRLPCSALSCTYLF